MDKQFKDIKKVQISNDLISPRLLFSHLYMCKDPFEKNVPLYRRTVYNYEIEFFLYSEGSMWINDCLYPIQAGDIVIRKPGDTTMAIMPFDCYAIFFDMTGNNLNNYERYFAQQNIFENFYINPMINSLPAIFHPQDGNKYLALFDKIHKEFINGDDNRELIIKSNILKILFDISNDMKNPFQHTNETPLQKYDRIRSVVEYINRNLTKKMDLPALAGLAGFSPNHFQKVFKEIIGISPTEYIINTRLKIAKEMLIMTRLSITDIAVKCGFENISYFSCLFCKRIGISPRNFRDKYTHSSSTNKPK